MIVVVWAALEVGAQHLPSLQPLQSLRSLMIQQFNMILHSELVITPNGILIKRSWVHRTAVHFLELLCNPLIQSMYLTHSLKIPTLELMHMRLHHMVKEHIPAPHTKAGPQVSIKGLEAPPVAVKRKKQRAKMKTIRVRLSVYYYCPL